MLEKEIKIQMVVCDMAGTTINEDNLVYKTLHKAINKVDYTVSLEQVLKVGAGKEKKEAIRSIITTYAERPYEPLVDIIFQDFLTSLEEAYLRADISAQPNAADFFSELKNRKVKVVLNTGYNRKTAMSLLQKLGWTAGIEIDALVTADEVNKNRPHPDMIFYAMNHFGIKTASSVAKIGDSMIDIEEGKNAGCQLNVGITTGAHTRAQLELAKPSFIVNNLLEMLPLIDSYRHF